MGLRLAASASMGADDPCLPTSIVFFQHLIQRDLLALAVADRFFGNLGLQLYFICGDCVFVVPDFCDSKSSAAIHAGAQADFTVLACAGKRFIAGGALVQRFSGQLS